VTSMISSPASRNERNGTCRFEVVVFNFERIDSFLQNFNKIRNFRPDRDRLLIVDCSVNHESEKRKVTEFARAHQWTIGEEIQVIKRKNWGIDQGGRVNYFSRLCKMDNKPAYVWQFQEHYLDLHSEWSIWPKEMVEAGGQLKQDTIPDNFNIDLDQCEQIYEKNPAVAVLYADRAQVGVFTHADGKETFFADGANFSVRAGDALEVFRPEILDSYRAIYDGTYEWALFLELNLCGQLTREGRHWHDLVSHARFDTVAALKALEDERRSILHQSAQPFYVGLYDKYERRFLAVLSEGHNWRKLHAVVSLWYVRLLSGKPAKALRRGLASIGLTLLIKRMNHYISGVLRHD
jgi:hypothetical protein